MFWLFGCHLEAIWHVLYEAEFEFLNIVENDCNIVTQNQFFGAETMFDSSQINDILQRIQNPKSESYKTWQIVSRWHTKKKFVNPPIIRWEKQHRMDWQKIIRFGIEIYSYLPEYCMYDKIFFKYDDYDQFKALNEQKNQHSSTLPKMMFWTL